MSGLYRMGGRTRRLDDRAEMRVRLLFPDLEDASSREIRSLRVFGVARLHLAVGDVWRVVERSSRGLLWPWRRFR